MSLFANEEDFVETTTSGIRVVNDREDQPQFKRTYRKTLDSRAKVEVEAKTFVGSRSFHGTLVQPNGNRVWFEPSRIADRILDPALVPLVAAFCEELFALDRAYVKSKPREFVDTGGTRWRRVE
jgi:hypothetical protein